MQVLAFSKLYEKYKDTDTSPAAESIEKTQIRLKQPFTYYYFIEVGGVIVGAVRVVDRNKENLDTILQEAGICHLYEKVGYRQTGRIRKVNDCMTLVFYRKG